MYALAAGGESKHMMAKSKVYAVMEELDKISHAHKDTGELTWDTIASFIRKHFKEIARIYIEHLRTRHIQYVLLIYFVYCGTPSIENIDMRVACAPLSEYPNENFKNMVRGFIDIWDRNKLEIETEPIEKTGNRIQFRYYLKMPRMPVSDIVYPVFICFASDPAEDMDEKTYRLMACFPKLVDNNECEYVLYT